MEEKKIKHKKLAIGVLFLCIIALTIVYGVIEYTKTINSSGTVSGYEIQLWRLDNNEEVTAINWGALDKGSNTDSDLALGLSTVVHRLAIKNVGDYVAYVGWHIDPSTPLPAGFTLTGQHANMETEAYQQTWNEDTFTFSVPAGTVSQWRIRWTLSVSEDATTGDFNFNILLLAADSSTG